MSDVKAKKPRFPRFFLAHTAQKSKNRVYNGSRNPIGRNLSKLNQEIAISVKNKIAETDFQEVVSFNSVYRLKFDFDEEWDEYPYRVAVVMWANGVAEKLFTGTECEMPQICSLDADSVLIGVYSRYGEKRLASSFVQLRCEAGAGGFPQPKPSLSLHEQILSFLNQKDWDSFENEVAEGVYSAVQVNKKGLVTKGMNILEVGKNSGDMPSRDLAPGGVFFRLKDGIYTPCYYDGDTITALKMTADNIGHSLTIGEQKFDGSEDVTVTLGALATKDVVRSTDLATAAVGTSHIAMNVIVGAHIKEKSINSTKLVDGAILTDKLGDGAVTDVKIADGAVTGAKIAEEAIKAGEHITVTRDDSQGIVIGSESSVFSVNGETGDVTIDKESLGLAEIAVTGSYHDLVDAPETGVFSVNGQTGEVTIDKDSLGLADIAVTGSFHDLVDAPETGVLSVNGKTGNVQLTGKELGFADVATSGSYDDLKDKPAMVQSVNGLSGEVTLNAENLGLGALATKDVVRSTDLATAAVGTSHIAMNVIVGAHIKEKSINSTKLVDGAILTDKLGDGAVTGVKLADGAVKAGANIAVSRDEENNVVVSTALTTGVTSVNGKTGDVTVDKESLGLGNVFPIGTEAEQGADFNDLTCGTYMAIGVEGKPCSHSPVSLDNPNGRDCCWALIAISASDGSHCTQIAFSGRDDVAVRLRNKVDGSWKNWKSIYA